MIHDNSNLQGKLKKLRVIGSSSYLGFELSGVDCILNKYTIDKSK